MSGLPLFLIVATVFLATFAAAGTLYGALRSRAATKRELLAHRLGTLGMSPGRIFKEDRHDPLVELMGPAGYRLEGLLFEAGDTGSVRGFLLRMVLIAVVAGALGWIAVGPTGLIAVVAGATPWLVLRSRARQRSRQLSEQLPDALDLAARTLKAGHALSDALRTCASEMPQPIGEEFGRVYEEHHLGKDLRAALTHLAERNPSNFDLRLVVSCLLLQRQTGGNLVELLDNIASTVRARTVFDSKVRALTAEARLSAGVLASLPFFVSAALIALRPTYLLPLINEPLGLWLLGTSAVAFTTGLITLRNIAQVEV
ncbi:MAG: type II secretion system F family protein [Deltaproteobacteria bacterium]|nr:type II secretion system F family protein [Deltaproteobacteria bacterium]